MSNLLYIGEEGPIGFPSLDLDISFDIRDKGDTATVIHPWPVYWNNTLYTIQPGYVTDGASIPRAFWRLIGHPFGAYFPAALLHDIFYDTHVVSREQADKALRDLMRLLPLTSWRASAIHRAVRIGGKGAYGKEGKPGIEIFLKVEPC